LNYSIILMNLMYRDVSRPQENRMDQFLLLLQQEIMDRRLNQISGIIRKHMPDTGGKISTVEE